MAKISTANWYIGMVDGNSERQFLIKASSAARALDHLIDYAEELYGNDWTGIKEPPISLDEWAEKQDVIAANELQFALGLLPEVNCSEAHIVLRT